MNSGTIAGLTSAPLKTKGWNLVQKTATSSNSISLPNNLPGTATVAQNSPAIFLTGNGWHVTNSIPRNVSFKIFAAPLITTSGNIAGNLLIQCSYNNSAYSSVVSIDSIGGISCSGITTGSVSSNQGRFSLEAPGTLFMWDQGHISFNNDAYLSRGGVNNLKQCVRNGDSATPSSQYFSVQNGSGTNISGVPRYIDGCQGTGTGSGGSIVFRTGTPGTTGAALNTLVESVTISPARTTITNEAKIERAAIVPNSNTTITLIAGDAGTVINCTANSPITINLPGTAMSVGYNVTIIQGGTGTIIFANNGQTLNAFSGLVSTAGQFASASIICTASTVYNLSGNLA